MKIKSSMQLIKVGVLFIGLIGLLSAYKPVKEVEATKWMSLDEAAKNLKAQKRPVLIDLYTDWCGWCKVMDRETYANKNVSKYLAEKYYPIKVNAESKQKITWNNRIYSFNPAYKTNEFAIFLTRGKLSYPTTVIIPADGSEPQAIPGYLKPKEFEAILKYFGEGAYGKIPFDEYHKKFKGSW